MVFAAEVYGQLCSLAREFLGRILTFWAADRVFGQDQGNAPTSWAS